MEVEYNLHMYVLANKNGSFCTKLRKKCAIWLLRFSGKSRQKSRFWSVVQNQP